MIAPTPLPSQSSAVSCTWNELTFQLHSQLAANERTVGAKFYCGDDPGAKSAVAELLRDVGVDSIDAAPLTNARFLEPAMMLLIQLAYPLRMGPLGLKLIRADEQ